MEENLQDQSGEKSIMPPMIPSVGRRFLFGIFIVVAPIFNFTFIEVLKPEWQDGKFSSYIDVFLLPEASIFFFVLLIYSIVSYILLLRNTDLYARSFVIRLGIYTGTFLALQYSLLALLGLDAPSSYFYILLIYLAPLLFARFHRWLTSKWQASLVNNILIGLGIVVLIAAMTLMDSPSSPFIAILMFIGVSAPFWCFLIALQASRWLWNYYETTLTFPRGLGILAWISAYGFALRFNILKMYELYAALPPQPPDCYIATAAANGHARFVGSQTVQLACGKTMKVNRQLQRLKMAEIALMVVSSPSHRWMRSIYDVVGKRLAMYIQNPILADVAYLFLLPIEWTAVFVLQFIVPEIHDLSKHLYHS